MAKIYVASSWRNEYQQEVVNFLKARGHEVYDFRNPPHGKGGFSWNEIDSNWTNWATKDYIKALSHQKAEKGFLSDFDAMKWADVCVMVLPCGRSANTEAGWMKGVGKKVFVYSPIKQEPELMYKLYDGITDNLRELGKIICMITGDQKRNYRRCISRKTVKLVDNGQTLKSFSVYIGDEIAMITGTNPEWMLDAYHGVLIDVKSLKIGERVRFASMVQGKIEETELLIESVEIEQEGSVDHSVDVNGMVQGGEIAGHSRTEGELITNN